MTIVSPVRRGGSGWLAERSSRSADQANRTLWLSAAGGGRTIGFTMTDLPG